MTVRHCDRTRTLTCHVYYFVLIYFVLLKHFSHLYKIAEIFLLLFHLM